MTKRLISSRARSLAGKINIPGDNLISQRSLILGSLSIGETIIEGLLENDEVLATAKAMQSFGATIEKMGKGVHWRVVGRGVGGLDEPTDVINCNNAISNLQLLIGAAVGQPITTFFTGNGSFQPQSLWQTVEPLESMGVKVVAHKGFTLPIAVIAPETLIPISYIMPTSSDSIKSAILIAGIAAPGETTLIETVTTYDHTEIMLRYFGAEINIKNTEAGRCISLLGEVELTGRQIVIPANPASAVFPAVAALLIEDSEILLPNVGVNPLRFYVFEALQEMGADIELINRRMKCGEPTADLAVRHSRLKGIEVPQKQALSMVNEYPIFLVAAACADGVTIMRGLISGMKVKERNQLIDTINDLISVGVQIEIDGADLKVIGASNGIAGGAKISVDINDCIILAFLVLGMVSMDKIAIDVVTGVINSFPSFSKLMNKAGASITNIDDYCY
ncbi:3-phosphoshikimate 1-carboxyvinyltransferase [Candidatus Endolissoclinum faulkneri]|uniref:3-phosphoshikimate 1-carboxyvinyltransferase n=1 Tax=Candidatus Endolissoclinum faulkneri TaxID=1263979 RepID=UPI0011D29A75|nr:3-phosphoshikimate 1-carboxyvinyltransferase [Candidatus Endolissoclinum faulkneri]